MTFKIIYQQIQGLEDDVSVQMSELDLDSICTTAAPMPSELVPSNATDVYNNYKFTPHYDGALPITRHREQVPLHIFIYQCIRFLISTDKPLVKSNSAL